MATAFTPTVFSPQGKADYRINPVAGVEYKPQDGMTQLNQILDYQGKQLDLTSKQELLQPKIEAGKAESKKLQLEAQKASVDLNQHFENIKRSTFGGFLTDPDFIDGNKEAMKKKIEASNEYLKSIGVPEMNAGKSHDEFLKLIDADPKQAYQAIKNGVQQAGGAQNQYQTIQQAQPPALYQPTQSTQQAPTESQFAQSQANMPVPELSQSAPLQYPVRVAGQPIALAPSEQADKDAGTALRSSLVNRQSSLTTDRRNIDEVIKTANELEKSWAPTSGILGSAYRHVATWMGDPTYKQLSKDLANVQMANIRAQGGSLDTVAGQQLSKMASGDETYPPSVLMNIAARAKADMTNIDAQATAAQKFSQKFGDNNMKAFQQMWSKNADSKVFEIMNIAKDSDLSAEEKKKVVDSLLGKDPEQRKIFNQKYQNILKLQQTGTL
jgi:hypothetical protein